MWYERRYRNGCQEADDEDRNGNGMEPDDGELAIKANVAETIIGNCTTTILLKSENKDDK